MSTVCFFLLFPADSFLSSPVRCCPISYYFKLNKEWRGIMVIATYTRIRPRSPRHWEASRAAWHWRPRWLLPPSRRRRHWQRPLYHLQSPPLLLLPSSFRQPTRLGRSQSTPVPIQGSSTMASSNTADASLAFSSILARCLSVSRFDRSALSNNNSSSSRI